VIVELSQPPAGPEAAREVADAVHNAALQRMRLPLLAVVVAPIGGIAKTPNGKAKRYACRQAFESGKYAPAAEIVWFNAELPADAAASDASHSGPSRMAGALRARIEGLRDRAQEER